MTDIKKIKEAILEENLSGWLFFNFRHRDPISDAVLKMNTDSINSRGWFYIVFYDREPLKIVHRVEKSILDHLRGTTVYYSSKEELRQILSEYRGCRFALQSDMNLTTLSYLDGGTENLIRSSGIETASAAPLIQRYLGILDPDQIESHEKAAEILYSTIEEVWSLITDSFKSGRTVTENFIADYIHNCFRKNSLVTEHRILTAFGKNTSDPHYETGRNDAPLAENTLIQFDIWAKEKGERGVYADISWIGYTGKIVPEKYISVFNTLTEARDSAACMINDSLSSGKEITGSEVDKAVRKILINAGYRDSIHHRTGHSIDLELHGYGVNIDSVEFPDSRKILEGSCFSIEPGLYFEDFGMRTEIDCYIRNKSLIISGKNPQKNILTF